MGGFGGPNMGGPNFGGPGMGGPNFGGPNFGGPNMGGPMGKCSLLQDVNYIIFPWFAVVLFSDNLSCSTLFLQYLSAANINIDAAFYGL